MNSGTFKLFNEESIENSISIAEPIKPTLRLRRRPPSPTSSEKRRNQEELNPAPREYLTFETYSKIYQAEVEHQNSVKEQRNRQRSLRIQKEIKQKMSNYLKNTVVKSHKGK